MATAGISALSTTAVAPAAAKAAADGFAGAGDLFASMLSMVPEQARPQSAFGSTPPLALPVQLQSTLTACPAGGDSVAQAASGAAGRFALTVVLGNQTQPATVNLQMPVLRAADAGSTVPPAAEDETDPTRGIAAGVIDLRPASAAGETPAVRGINDAQVSSVVQEDAVLQPMSVTITAPSVDAWMAEWEAPSAPAAQGDPADQGDLAGRPCPLPAALNGNVAPEVPPAPLSSDSQTDARATDETVADGTSQPPRGRSGEWPDMPGRISDAAAYLFYAQSITATPQPATGTGCASPVPESPVDTDTGDHSIDPRLADAAGEMPAVRGMAYPCGQPALGMTSDVPAQMPDQADQTDSVRTEGHAAPDGKSDDTDSAAETAVTPAFSIQTDTPAALAAFLIPPPAAAERARAVPAVVETRGDGMAQAPTAAPELAATVPGNQGGLLRGLPAARPATGIRGAWANERRAAVPSASSEPADSFTMGQGDSAAAEVSAQVTSGAKPSLQATETSEPLPAQLPDAFADAVPAELPRVGGDAREMVTARISSVPVPDVAEQTGKTVDESAGSAARKDFPLPERKLRATVETTTGSADLFTPVAERSGAFERPDPAVKHATPALLRATLEAIPNPLRATTIEIQPEGFGRVQIRLSPVGHGSDASWRVDIRTADPAVRALLLHNLDELRQSLGTSQVNVQAPLQEPVRGGAATANAGSGEQDGFRQPEQRPAQQEGRHGRRERFLMPDEEAGGDTR